MRENLSKAELQQAEENWRNHFCVNVDVKTRDSFALPRAERAEALLGSARSLARSLARPSPDAEKQTRVACRRC